MKHNYCGYYILVCKNFISYLKFIKYKLEEKLPLSRDEEDFLSYLCERIESDEE